MTEAENPSPALLEELEQLRQERAYLLARADQAGRMRFGGGRDTGVSSNALVRHAFSGEEVGEEEFPRDPDDLAACYRARERAPQHLHARMDALLSRYREHVGKRYPEVLEEAGAPRGPERQGMPIEEFIARMPEFVTDASPAQEKGKEEKPGKRRRSR